MFEKEAEEYCGNLDKSKTRDFIKDAFKDGAEFGYNKAFVEADKNLKAVVADFNKANEWFDAKTSIPLPKKVEIYRYTLEVISDKGDIVCYDYKDKDWKKLVIEDEKVTYVPVEIKMWCNKPTKESE